MATCTYYSLVWVSLLSVHSIIEDDIHKGVVHVATIAPIVAFWNFFELKSDFDHRNVHRNY